MADKAKKICMEIQDVVDNITKDELSKPSLVEYYKNLVKLKYYLAKCQEEDEKAEYSQRMGSRAYAYDSYREGPEWGAYADGSMRGRGERYTSYGADPKQQLRELMQNPDMSYEAKEHLRKAMEAVR